MAADPELVKALIDAAAAAFQAHSDYAGVDEVAQRVATATGQSRIARPDNGRAVLVHLRGAAASSPYESVTLSDIALTFAKRHSRRYERPARLGRPGNLREAGQCPPQLPATADAQLCEHRAQVPSGRGVPVQVHRTDADPIFAGAGDSDAARQLARQASDAELFLCPGDQHYFADSSLPPYDADATAHLIERMLDFLRARPASRETVPVDDHHPGPQRGPRPAGRFCCGETPGAGEPPS